MGERQGTCPYCGRTGLSLNVNELVPRHKPAPEVEPRWVEPDGYCYGGGGWVNERRNVSAGSISWP